MLAVVLAVLVISQEKQWKDELTVLTSSSSLRRAMLQWLTILRMLTCEAAVQLADDGRCSEAMPVFEQVSQEYPQDWYAWAGLGDCFAQVNTLPNGPLGDRAQEQPKFLTFHPPWYRTPSSRA